MNVLKYKHWTGLFEYEPEDELFHGRVLGLRDVIHFCGSSVEELKQSLADSVEDYLEACEAFGKKPERPHSGKLTLRLSPEEHAAVASAAAAKGMSINAWISQTVAREAGNVL